MAYGLKGIEKLLSDLKEKEDKLKQKVYNNKVGYAPKCKVCNSPLVHEIEELREEGYTLEDILEELEITDISIMSLSRHFKNHYPKSKEYKQKQLIEALENMKEAYINYPYLEDYFKDKPLEEIENFNREYGFCTDTFTLCEYIPAGKVSNCNMTVNRLDIEAQKEILENKKNRFYFDDNDKNQIFITNVRNRIDCLNCKNEYNEKRLNLLEKIITYNFLNITPENKELYYTLLNFNGNPEEFIETLGKGKEE